MAGQVRVRLNGLPEDVEKTAVALRVLMHVVEESADYPNRNSEFVRRYLTVIAEPPQGDNDDTRSI